MDAYSIGVDVGGTRVKAVAVAGGKVLERRSAATIDDDRGAWKTDARELIRALELSRGRAADWIGVCSPGIVAPDGLSIWWMEGKMETSVGFQWAPWLGRTTPVPVFNDAHAALLGETHHGAAKGAQHVVLLTLGTGVGGAVMVDGRILRGHLGRAGHLGHMSVDMDGPADLARTPGSIEYHIGDYSVAERSGGRFQTTWDLAANYNAGDAGATRVWLKSVKALAVHLSGVINAFDPEVVVLGGGIADAGFALTKPLAGYLDEFEWRPHGRRVRVVRAAFDDDAGAIGAAYGAMTMATSGERK